MAFLCLGGLLSRVLPDVFPIAPNVLDQRLSYPITYWNGVGLLAALAIVFATHLTCSAREHPAARVVGAASCRCSPRRSTSRSHGRASS